MDLITVIGIAVGLSMDAFAVSIASGCSTKGLKFYQALRMALFFGGFQAAMPIIGWLAGLTFRSYIESFDHWLALGLLSIIGIKMIVEFFEKDKPDSKKACMMDLPSLFVLSVATSIDALAVGLSLSFLHTSIYFPALLIGLVTFLFTLCGVYIGKYFGHIFEKKIELIGGLILIGIGIKIVLEHTMK
jgi:manganese efflux pump family protein